MLVCAYICHKYFRALIYSGLHQIGYENFFCIWSGFCTHPNIPVDKPVSILFVPQTFSWDSPDLYSSFKLFKQKVEFVFKGQFKDCDGASKVSAILNWLGNNAYEVCENLHWEAAAHKTEPDCVLEAFKTLYFKPEQNHFHSWYILGSIYSGQFKCQYDFLNRLKEVAHDCSFTNADEIVCFLFLTHNQSTRVREGLLKAMKITDSLHDTLQIARIAEGKMHSEELSKQYLDTVKKDTQVDSMHKSKQHRKASHGHKHGRGCSGSGK